MRPAIVPLYRNTIRSGQNRFELLGVDLDAQAGACGDREQALLVEMERLGRDLVDVGGRG